jgi:Flp pilus assembly protein TadD
LGDAYAASSRFPEAEGAYQQSIKYEPANWYGYVALGYFYVERGGLAEARTAFETAQNLTLDNEIVFRNIAALDSQEGKFQEAADLYSKSLKFKKGARTYNALGLTYYYPRRY